MPYKDPAKRREANKLNARKLRAKDPEKYRAACRGWYGRNLERARDYERARACQKYGITVEQFEAMLAAQTGKCAVCETAFGGLYDGPNTSPRIDHCHETGTVRGLLCNRCNRAIGLFCDDAAVMEKAAGYIRDHSHAL